MSPENSTNPALPTGRKPSGLRHYSAIHLLIALALLFILSPFVEDLSFGRAVEGVMVTLVLISALVAVSGRGSVLVGMLLAMLALGGQWISFVWPGTIVAPLYLFAAIVFLGFVISRLLKFVLTATEVNLETLCACVAGFLMIGLLWTMLYTLLARLSPGAFAFSIPGQTMDGFEAFYFSFVTLSTIGFGDIAPVSHVARMLSVMEAITGMFYVAVLVARLVSIYSSPRVANTDNHRDLP